MRMITTAFKVNLPDCWLAYLQGEFDQPYMGELQTFLQQEKSAGKVVYPKSSDIFNAFNSTLFDDVKVVVLGQDPYHGIGQAHGLSFSVLQNTRVPPSLVNIFKEIHRDLGGDIPQHGCLQSWAQQGVLLLNATLTVEQANAGSHQKKGWETFTDKVIELLNEQQEHIVFLLWGAYAQKKGRLINQHKHLVLSSVHPSPLSAYRGFIGNGHFSKANAYLAQQGRQPIDWLSL
jgi:uracil-DNA glycosylase